ncbi:MAG: beta-propeller domain-containing protein [Candidatus Thiodiazotropha sp. L084R]
MSKPIMGGISAIILTTLLALQTGCNSSNNDDNANSEPPTDQKVTQLSKFEHCEDLKSYLITTSEQQSALLEYVQSLPPETLDDFNDQPSPTPTSGSEQPAINNLTGTNNQVTGVDEADFVKTDGETTYLLSGGYLTILQTWPADQSQELSRTEIDGVPRALFAYDDIVWVISDLTQDSYPHYEESLAEDFSPRINQMTKITLLQVTDPTQPSVIRETVLESGYVDARRIGQQVYLIVSAQLELNSVTADPENVEIDDLLPMLSDNRAPSTTTLATTSPICGCDDIYQPTTATGTGTLTILDFDLEDPLADISSETVLGNSSMVYASQENLYIASIEDSNWLWLPMMEGEESLTPSTTIHKFSLGTTPQYLASGSVDGHLLNQFSMDEYQGALRLVTTEQPWWSDADPENRLYVMEQSEDQLVERALLDGLGKPGESVFAVRFDQARGYVATFEQIDPLITLDLSDPSNPLVAGELEVPGLSTYLHPIEGDMLLAIGQDTDTSGIKLSLFDISNFSQPALLSDHLVSAGSYTEAAYNHHAFTWFEQEQMLAIPVTEWNSNTSDTDYGIADIFNGLELFSISADEGIQPYASIDHDIFYQDQESANWFYPSPVNRSFFVSDDANNSYIYSISERGFLVNNLATPDSIVAQIPLPTESDNVYLFSDVPLTRFSQCDDLKSYLITTNERQNELIDYSYNFWGGGGDDFSSAPISSPITPPESILDQNDSEPTVNSVTGTNNQVVGVDEADFIKTNGNFTYLLSGGNLVILKTWPVDQSEELSRTAIDGTPRVLFFYEDIVWVVSDLYRDSTPGYEENLGADVAPRVDQMTKITLLQITDPQQPELLRETVFESQYVDARRIDQQVYLIVRAQINLNGAPISNENIEIEELLPIQVDNRAPSTDTQATTSVICGCDATYRPEIPDGTGTVTILGFDLQNPLSDITSQSILGNAGTTVYANRENLYIASIEDPYWFWGSFMDGADHPSSTTTIHKFTLGTSPEYIASGQVSGHLINHFAMDEYESALRVVTTDQDWWTGETNNRLYVLAQSGDQLAQRAYLDGLGKPWENLYAVRFNQDKGFLVTFEQIDPLIAVDLSDSRNPFVAGELEVPGFSTYLHPIEGEKILAIGRESGDIKLSLFDISDLSQPTLLFDHLDDNGSYSEAGDDHHAFTWFEQEKILALPVSKRYFTLGIYIDFNGLELFKVTADDGIQLYGTIDHNLFYEDAGNSNSYYPEGIRRSFIVTDDTMNNYIYSISSRGLLINDLAAPDVNLMQIELPPESND